MYLVVLAGGGGTRLWPLSTPERPKPFLPLLGERSLLRLTVDRLAGLVDRADVFVVTDRRYGGLVRAQVPGAVVLDEPVGRSTAAAVALATLAIERPEDEVMAVVPADHRIANVLAFQGVLRDAERGVARGAFGIESPLVVTGIQVDWPATEYGYLIPREEYLASNRLDTVVEGLRVYPLAAFEEKPSRDRAELLWTKPGVAWNAGIFLARRRAMRRAFAEFAPDIIGRLERGLAAGDLEAAYGEVRTTSIDHAVMEQAADAGRVVMGAMDVGWSDLGSWTALLSDLGGAGTGRVVQAGETADAGPDDLVVERVAGRLTATGGPRGILATTPTALLTGAAASRPIIDALLERVSVAEAPA